MKRIITAIALSAILMSSCGSKTEKKEVLPLETVPEVSSSAPTEHPGKKVYDQYCKACHQNQGQGVPSIFPPLTPNKYVEDKEQIIAIVLNGMSGKMELDGETYNGLMTPHAHLTNQQLADVITYVRSSFGNQLEGVSPDEIQAARQ